MPAPDTLHGVLQVMKEVVGGEVASDDSLLQEGLDSPGPGELRNVMSASFKVNLPPILTFTHPSISAIAHASQRVSSGSRAWPASSNAAAWP